MTRLHIKDDGLVRGWFRGAKPKSAADENKVKPIQCLGPAKTTIVLSLLCPFHRERKNKAMISVSAYIGYSDTMLADRCDRFLWLK